MSIGVKVKVWGDYTLFSRPEMKVERYTYDVMTPSAARGILDAVYWHLGMHWTVDRIYVMKPICQSSSDKNYKNNWIKEGTFVGLNEACDKVG